jgi:peptide deformylase
MPARSFCNGDFVALRTIIEYPDPRLRRKARPVTEFGPDLAKLIDDMAESMYAAPGIGLAAVQVDVLQRVIVIDISEHADQLREFVNPELLEQEGAQEIDEGCLSVPGVYAPVPRAERVRVRALDRRGEPFELEADGLLAVCIQHEMDHLDGKVFVDYLSRLRRERIEKRLLKARRQRGGDPDRPAQAASPRARAAL